MCKYLDQKLNIDLSLPLTTYVSSLVLKTMSPLAAS